MESLINNEEVLYSKIMLNFLSIEDDKLFEKTKAQFIKEKAPTTIKDFKTIDGKVSLSH